MTIPFVRQYPNGRRGLTEIECPTTIEAIGRQFIAGGGCYLIEILTDGHVRMAACLLDGNDKQQDVEEIICGNDPELKGNVNLLISRSFKHVSVKETEH
jgi:hypothetical protein